MKTQMFIKKNLFFLPSRLVFQQAGSEIPNAEEEAKKAVEAVEKKTLEQHDFYESAKDAFQDANSNLQQVREKFLVGKPPDVQEAVNKEFEKAEQKLKDNADRFGKVIEYAKKLTELREREASPLFSYDEPFKIIDIDQYKAVLKDQKVLEDFTYMAHGLIDSKIVSANFAALKVENMRNNTIVIIDSYFDLRLKTAEDLLINAKKENDPERLPAYLDGLDQNRTQLQDFMNQKFEGGTTDKYLAPTQALLKQITAFILEKTMAANDYAALNQDTKWTEANLQAAHKAAAQNAEGGKAWEQGAESKSQMLAAKTDYLIARGLLDKLATRDQLRNFISTTSTDSMLKVAYSNEKTNFTTSRDNYRELAKLYRKKYQEVSTT